MHHATLVHVLERVANQAEDPERIFLRERPVFIQQVRQRATPEQLHDDVRTRLLLDRDDFEERRMIEFAADLLFALETPEIVRVGFVSQVGHLYCDQSMMVERILSLINRGHAASADGAANQKPSVQERTWLQFRG